MHYLIASNDIAGALGVGCRVIAEGEMLSFEEPWAFDAPLIARVEDAAALDAVKSRAVGVASAFAVEGFDEPGSGQAIVIAAHLMRDMEMFKPYAAAVPDVIKRFGGRFLARAGKLTPVAGSFMPDRAILIEFPTADDAVAFYFSDAYAPLLKIRLAATDPRFGLVARSGRIPDSARAAVARHLRAG